MALECSHPDIEDFLTIKMNDTDIQMANLSVMFTDEFMQAVIDDKEFELSFDVKDTGEKIRRKIKAKDFFYKFCEVQRDYGEPGSLYIDKIKGYNMLSGYPKDEYEIACCNP